MRSKACGNPSTLKRAALPQLLKLNEVEGYTPTPGRVRGAATSTPIVSETKAVRVLRWLGRAKDDEHHQGNHNRDFGGDAKLFKPPSKRLGHPAGQMRPAGWSLKHYLPIIDR